MPSICVRTSAVLAEPKDIAEGPQRLSQLALLLARTRREVRTS